MKKPVMFLKNITLEGPGIMEMFLRERNIPYEIRDLYAGNPLPGEVTTYGAVVILGGPMNVDEELKYPFLQQEKKFIGDCLQKKVPILGICLGAQLLARTLESRVYKNRKPEIGCMTVDMTPTGVSSPLFFEIYSPVDVFQWHGDTFDMPDGAKHLAQSAYCPHQAFGYEDFAFGLQFHIEVTREEAQKWATAYLPDLQGEERTAALDLMAISEEQWPKEISKTAGTLCRNFFGDIAKLFD